VTELLKGLKPAAKVEINSEKPRKGTFEIRVGGKKIISCVGMPRPFAPLKALDMEDTAKKVAAAL
jgi:hypothetical protein